MLFSLGGNTVDVDIEKTEELYKRLPYVWCQCQCPACRNFEERVTAMRVDRFKPFREMGVDLLKCQYLWAYEPGDKPSTQKYCVRYPLVCKAVDFEDGRGWELFEKELLACFALEDNEICLVLDWTLKWGSV